MKNQKQIANNLCLNQHDDNQQTPKITAKVYGKKVQNQEDIYIIDELLPERIGETSSAIYNKKNNKSLLATTPKRLLKKIRRNSLLGNVPEKSYKKKTEKINSKIYNTSLDHLNIGTKPKNLLPMQTTREKKFDKRKLIRLNKYKISENMLEIISKNKGFLNLGKQLKEIPYASNRFQGKYKDVVPPKYKETKMALRKEKLAKEVKKQESKQKAIKIKEENDKIRRDNKIGYSKQKNESIPRKNQTLKKELKPTIKERDKYKEIGLEFFLHLKNKGIFVK